MRPSRLPIARWKPAVIKPRFGRLAQARREFLRPDLADENAHAHLVLYDVERDVDMQPPPRPPAVARHHQHAACRSARWKSRCPAASLSALPGSGRGAAEPGPAEQRRRRLRRQWMQLRRICFVGQARTEGLALAARDVGKAGAGQGLVQIQLRLDLLALFKPELVLQVFGQRSALEALHLLGKVRRHAHIEAARAALVALGSAQRQQHPTRVDAGFQQIGPPPIGRF